LIAEEGPDIVAVVPVIRVPALVDFLKAAAEAGVATAIWVQSWDNLTNKGLLHFVPDRVFVWNESQREELARYHGVSGDAVSVTGAQTFDHWFNGDPVPDRAEFCRTLDVDPTEPIILYLASSKQIAPDEPTFFARWLRALREGPDPSLRRCTVLLRPHPTLAAAWHARDFARHPGVVVSPSTLGAQINSEDYRTRYRAELHHSTVAVGINTSGLIDAAIFGKPACTVELQELFHGQRGTVHFQHLSQPEGGLLRISPSLDEHLAMLSELVRRDTYESDDRSVAFVRRFVRPHGLEVTPADVFVQDILELSKSRSHIAETAGTRRLVGAVIARLAWLLGAPLEETPARSIFRHLGRQLVAPILWLERDAPAGGKKPDASGAARLLRRHARRFVYAIARRVLPRRIRRMLRREVAFFSSR
jgi:hypothetical protein